MAMKGSAAWILAMNSSGKIVYWAGVTTTPISDGSTTNPVVINGSSVTIRPGGAVGYNGNEFVLSESGVWQEFGETDVQHKTLDTPIDVDGTEVTTVEGALGAINGYVEDVDEDLETGLASQIDLLRDTVGWAGKNLLPLTLENLKAVNTYGTWNGNSYTNAGTTFTIYTDSQGYVTDIKVNRITAASGNIDLYIGGEYGSTAKFIENGEYTFSIDNSKFTFYIGYSESWSDSTNSSKTVNIENGISWSLLRIPANATVDNDSVHLQIERGSTATTYEPYHASVADTIPQEISDVVGWDVGELLNITATSTTKNGVTFIVNDDGSISTSGTSNAEWVDFILNQSVSLKTGKYKLSGCNGGAQSTYRLVVFTSPSTTHAILFNGETTFTLDSDTTVVVQITVRNPNVNMNGKVFKPSITHITVDEQKADKSDLDTKLAKTTVALDESSLVASKAYVVDEEFLINDILYKAKLPINQNGAIAIGTNCEVAGSIGNQLKSINDKITILDNKVFSVNVLYAFHIDGNESDPLAKVKYLEDCAGFTSAYMDFQNGVFRYGSWSEDEFFMPKPCMLKYDGTVDYYLANHDFTKKADGITASDVADTAYAGNAMLEFGRDDKKIWYKIVPDSGDSSSFTIYIADGQLDEDFHCWSFINNQGILVPHFYLSIYNGSVISDVMRSISGQAVSKSLTGTAEREKARANNQGANRLWDIECFADFQLIEFLTWLISRSTDSQKAFGTGLTDSGSEAINNDFRTGVHNAKGLFYGTNSGAAATYTNAVKVFGKENLWGFQWRRLNGWCMYDGVQKIKLTRGTQDGSTATDYNDDGTNYLSMGSGSTPSGSSGGYCKNSLANANAVVPQGINGNSVSHYCDGLWFNNSGARLALVGGASTDGARCGVSSATLPGTVSFAYWGVGASLSCKPLA